MLAAAGRLEWYEENPECPFYSNLCEQNHPDDLALLRGCDLPFVQSQQKGSACRGQTKKWARLGVPGAFERPGPSARRMLDGEALLYFR